jgi:transposase-like protein
MSPQPLFCLNLDCPSRGKVHAGNIVLHSGAEDRFCCHTCGITFTVSKGTVFYRLKTDPEKVILVLTLLAYGCPLQAIVAAFGLDPRTVANWQKKAGEHCKRLHEHLVVGTPRDLLHVQADEVRAKLQKRLALWMAMAIQVPTRLWLGGEVGPHRDKQLIRQLAVTVRLQALVRPILLVTDGLSSYVTAWKRVFVHRIRGERGAARRVPWEEMVIAQVIKCYEKLRAIGVDYRLLAHGRPELFPILLRAGQVLNTAYIERLNATFRQRMCSLVRRGRCLLRRQAVLEQAMYLVGCVYNFCTPHKSLRVRLAGGAAWTARTPAMAARITDEIWRVGDLLEYRVPPPPPPPSPMRTGKPGRPRGPNYKPKVAEAVAP